MKAQKTIAAAVMAVVLAAGMTGCASGNVNNSGNDETNVLIQDIQTQLQETQAQLDELKKQLGQVQDKIEETDYVQKCYNKIKYIDENISDRDCIAGEQFTEAQNWIKSTLTDAGYSNISTQEVSFTRYLNITTYDNAVSECTTDGKYYKRENRNYAEVEKSEATHVLATVKSDNIIVKKEGKSDKQIIVGAHYDGDGTGDNGSGISLALTMAEKLADADVPNTVVFVFFTAEEYGCFGSTAYANAMTDDEVANTLYMVNMDSLICGDYCYLYGGVQDDENQTVTMTAAYENAMSVATSLGLEFKSNPWTYANPAPGYDTPDYASPSTGDWSDHVGFKNRGIMYVYFEATNWEIPGPYDEYDGYGETYLVGMLMNTENDYLEYIETYFPGRPQKHLYNFFTLLNALLIQPNVNF